MKKPLRHRVRVIAILFAFAVAIGPTSFTWQPGRTKIVSLKAIDNVQLLAPTLLVLPFSFSIGQGKRQVLWQHLFLRHVSFRRPDFTAA